MIIGGIGGILGIFISGLAASFGDVIAKNEIKTLQKSHQEFELFYYMIITIVYSAALLLVIPFVQLYTKGVNDVNYIIPTLSFLFVFNGLLYNIKTPQGMWVIAAGRYKQTKWQSTIQALLILLIALPLAPFFGLYGILIGLICSNIYRDIDLLFFIPKYVTKLSYKFTLKRILLVLFNFSIAAVVFLFIEIQCASFTDWIIYATLITSVITIWVLLTNILIDKKNIINIYLRIKKLI
jgi:O-antigen/teichoic acid export membrane protein